MVDHRNSNIDWLRLLLANCVLVRHCLGQTTGTDPLFEATGGQLNLGSTAVWLFFALSGYLVLQSRERCANVGEYALRRWGRIWPGFVAASLLITFVVGPIATGLPFLDYVMALGWESLKMLVLASPETPNVWGLLSYHQHQGHFFWQSSMLNSPMWTIPMEECAYIIIALLFALGAFKTKWMAPALFLACWIPLVVWGLPKDGFWHYVGILPAFLFAGATVKANAVPLSHTMAVISLGLLLLSLWLGVGLIAAPIVLSYLAFWFSFRGPKMPSLNWDLSYGVYLYHWPVLQLLLRTFGVKEPYMLLAWTLPSTFGLAMISWLLIERPMKEWARARSKTLTRPAIA